MLCSDIMGDEICYVGVKSWFVIRNWCDLVVMVIGFEQFSCIRFNCSIYCYSNFFQSLYEIVVVKLDFFDLQMMK